jgi:hypothetical protein
LGESHLYVDINDNKLKIIIFFYVLHQPVQRRYSCLEYWNAERVSNTTSRILDVLEEQRPRVICIDELDKMSRQFQNQLLNFLDSGGIKVDQQRRSYNFEIRGAKVFATCNEINRLSKPLHSRFRSLHIPKYSREQFLEIAVKVCPKLSEEIALIIAEETWEQHGGRHQRCDKSVQVGEETRWPR